MITLRTSDKKDIIFKALIGVQKNLEPINADAVNTHFKNKYATIGAVLDVLFPTLVAADLALFQIPTLTTLEAGQTRLDLETIIIHIDGEWVSFTLSMPLPKTDPQGVGIAIAYARRYALMSFFSMTTEDNDGNMNPSQPQKAKPQPQKSKVDIEELRQKANRLIAETGVDWVDVVANANKKGSKNYAVISDLPIPALQEAIRLLEAKKKNSNK